MDKLVFKCVPAEVGLQQLVFSNDDIDIIVRTRTSNTKVYNINVIEDSSSSIHLTNRERDILLLIAAGFSNQDISDRLKIALVTVKKYVSILLSKINVTNRVMLSNYYYGYLDEL